MSAGAPVPRPVAGGVRLDLRVIPRASKTTLGGVRDGRLVARVTAPPVDSAANAAVVQLLADVLDVPRSSVRIVAGHASRQKSVQIDGVDAAYVLRRLSGRDGADDPTASPRAGAPGARSRRTRSR